MTGGSSTGSRTKHVLLVEDDSVSLKLMRDVLAANGYETSEATNGLDALARAGEAHVDLIVMDIGLPDLDGVEVTRRLRGAPATQSIPVIAVTAYAMPGDGQRVLAAGCDRYLTKPLSFATFVAEVRSILGDA